MNLNKPVALLLFALFSCLYTASQIEVDNGVNATDAVELTLLGEGIVVSNITFSGDDNQIGTFDCVDCNLGLAAGVIMASGDVAEAEGPNSIGSTTQGGGNFGAGDVDLETLNPGFTINDAAILEFDFVATGDSVKFNYVWASEEYPEYVNSSFNDVFGFFLSGPGIAGPYTNDAENIALIPGTTLPVTIDNVNDFTNSEYYVDNSATGSDITQIEYDGFTVPLTAEAGGLICGETYHIKIAVADAGDTGWDSAVFLEEGSFESNQIDVNLQIVDIAANDSTLYEGCGTANILFTRSEGVPDEASFAIEVIGVAENGIDFTFIPDSLTFGYDEYEIIFPFEAFEDGVLEGLESVTLSFSTELCNSDNEEQTFTFYIGEADPLVAEYENVTIDCGETALLEVTVTGGYGFYNAIWEDGTEGYTLEVSPGETSVYSITVSDTCQVEPITEDVIVTIPDYPDLIVDVGPDQALNCMDNLLVNPDVSGGFGSYTYEWNVNGEFVSNDVLLDYLTDDEGTVTLIITDECGATESDLLNFEFPEVSVLVDLGESIDVTCISSTVLSADVSGGIGIYSYSWEIDGVEVGTNSSYVIETEEEVTVTLTVTDQCENVGQDNLIVDVPPVPAVVDLGPDIDVTCLDFSNLSASTSGGIGAFSYSWFVGGEEVSNGPNYQIQVDGLTTVVVMVEDACGNIASDEIVIDTPPVPIGVDLGGDMEVICIDLNTLDPDVSGGVGDYTYEWEMEGDNLGSDPTVEVSTASTVQVVVIVEDECGNVGMDEINLIVPEVPISIEFSQDSVSCSGQPVDVHAFSYGGLGNHSYEWLPIDETGSSITVTPEQSTTYTVVVSDQCGNVGSASFDVYVHEVHANFDFDYISEWSIDIYNTSVGADFYVWDLDMDTVSTEEEPVVSYYDLDSHDITLWAISELGCADSITGTFHPLMNLFIPNTFTPNNDGVNDFFKVEGHDVYSFEIWIFNRWGDLVYNSIDMDDIWDGSMMGGSHFVPNGTYMWRVKAVGIRENGIEKTGTISVIR